MSLFSRLISLLAPIFLVVSPITSYADQILSMHRTRSSSGFSLDIPLIMLSASIIKLFYYPGARFDTSLLLQALVMLVVQSILLKVALDNRPTLLRTEAFEMKINGSSSGSGSGLSLGGAGGAGPLLSGNSGGMETPTWVPKRTSDRPFDFWRWRDTKPYWQFLGTLAGGLFVAHVLIRPAPGRAEGYTSLLGAVGLGIEALVPLPQLWQNYRGQSCKGFRLSVIINWLLGDTLKLTFFFLTSASGDIPFSFKACGVFQAACDCLLGVQYAVYGEGTDYDDGHFA